jgi:hypothetical protein
MDDKKEKIFKGTVTVTFAEVVENHVGMEQLGIKRDDGFTTEELRDLNDKISDSFLYEMSYKEEKASILVIKNGLDMFGITADQLEEEHLSLLGVYDKKFLNKRRNIVQNKRAHYNTCFADMEQVPNYEEGKGTVIGFSGVPLLEHVRDNLHEIFGEKAKGLNAEGNNESKISVVSTFRA